MQELTLVYLLNGNHVCLGYKKRGHGAGYYNGFGGKVEVGETVLEAAVRELKEECGVVVETAALRQVAHNEFIYPAEGKHYLVHVFIVRDWQRDPIATDEMHPEWFSLDKLPFDAMWQTDEAWLLLALGGTRIRCFATFDSTGKTPLMCEVETVEEF